MEKVGIIKLTQRMLNKSIIDANKSIVAFAKEYLPVDYEHIENGAKVVFQAIFDDDTPSQLRLYRRPRGDRLLSIQGITKKGAVGDTVTIVHESGDIAGKNYYVRINITKAAS
jgi:hypothetical protein